mmetsp:Transcript_5638/g.14284  ORF Transcript_5638/g.14284 Transcript_5638/m.14284 type:complete len:125 (+) Transcript_5638:596-970(+)
MRGDMGEVYARQAKHLEALDSFREVLRIRRKLLGDKHKDVAESYVDLGTILDALGEHDAALEHLEKALEILIQAVGEESREAAAVQFKIARICSAQGSGERAKGLFEWCARMCSSTADRWSIAH